MKRAVLALDGIHKHYRLGRHMVPALNGVALQVRSGEMLALTGPSGSGKSTLLNIAGLIDSPDRGSVTLLGRDATRLNARDAALLRRDAIGFVFQSFNLVPVMSVADNVDFPLFLQGVAQRERVARVNALLAEVGLREHARYRPDELSGGQRQRVALARALIKQPRLLIADEPTANLDSKTADQVLALMQALTHLRGTAVLIATHDEQLVSRCDRVIRLLDGGLPNRQNEECATE